MENVELVKVEIVTSMAKVEMLRQELGKFGISGMTVYEAKGCGVQLGTKEYEAQTHAEPTLLDKQVVMVVLEEKELAEFLDFVEKELYTGHIGDGKIFISPIMNVVRIRTGEEGSDAIAEGKAY